MIDINLIRNNKEKVEEALLKRIDKVYLTEILEKDTKKRTIGTRLDEMRNERKTKANLIAEYKREGKDTTNLVEETKKLREEIDALDNEYKTLDKEIYDYLITLPNMPDDDIAPGGKENNETLREYGTKREYNFNLIPHYELLKNKGMVDYERGVKLGGEKNWIYKGMGARLEWALINYFIDTHLKDGYEFMMLPYMLNYECGIGAGQFPKFDDEVYKIEGENKFLLPTAETALVNYHANEIMDIKDLPKKYFAYTQCFRVEAGSSREEERGTIRGHQFNKVEMVQYVTEENVDNAFNELLNKAEQLVKDLGLHYRLTKLAAGDCSAAMCRTYDIEVWIPSMGIYKEVSSVSNSRTYQARRNNTKYRDENGNLHYICTLNASGLATSRLVPAIVEQFQNEDGTFTVPLVLRKYLDNIERI